MKFTIGGVFNRAFGLMGQNAVIIFGMALITVGLPTLGGTFYIQQFVVTEGQDPPLLISFGFGLTVVLLSFINYSLITELALVKMVGRRFNLGAAMGRAVLNILPLLFIGVLGGLAILAGLAVLIIPGIFVAICFSLSGAAYIGERGIGIFGAMSRSWNLTENHRWALLLIFILMTLLTWMVGAAAKAPMGFVGDLPPVVTLGVFSLIDTLIGVINLVFNVAAYVALREAKEGRAPETLANVFE